MSRRGRLLYILGTFFMVKPAARLGQVFKIKGGGRRVAFPPDIDYIGEGKIFMQLSKSRSLESS
jgi:hypothetical protein